MKILKSRIALFAAVAILSAVGAAFAADRPNFNGTWVLQKDKSANLPGLFQAVDEYLLIVTQPDEKSITVAKKFTGRGQTISDEAQSFPIDGSTIEKKDNRGVTLKRSFRYDAENPRLLVDTERIFTGQVQLPNTSEGEVWELSDEGKTLTITITPKTGNGQKEIRVFSKKE